MKGHDADKLAFEVKLKVEHLTLLARDRSVATRLIPHESRAASHTTFLALIRREVPRVLHHRTSRISRCFFSIFFPEDWKDLVISIIIK